jgi:quercetin dioxygenase-like cupin family protein
VPGRRGSLPPGRGAPAAIVLSGIARLQLGERTILVHPGQAAEFSTMVPHAIDAQDGPPVEILTMFDHDGERAHLHAAHDTASP